jgi:hypothetical protein
MDDGDLASRDCMTRWLKVGVALYVPGFELSGEYPLFVLCCGNDGA